MSHVDLGATPVASRLGGLRVSHADLEVYVYRMRTWSESECEGIVLAFYIWSNVDHVKCGRS